MRAFLIIAALASPALALTEAQLANKVRNERRQYDNAQNALDTRKEKLAAANDKLNGMREAKEDGAEKGKFGGQACKIDNCIAKQQKAVEKQERLAAQALAEAKKQAQQYIDAENAYAAKSGHFLSPASLGEATDFLKGAPTVTTTGGTEDGVPQTPADKPCVDSRGIPCIGDGTTDFESPTGTVDKAGPVVDPADAANLPDRVPGTGIGDLATGHEGEDLARFASNRAGAGVGYGGGAPTFRGDERVALQGSHSADLAAVRADIARGAKESAQAAIAEMLRKNPRDYQARFLDAVAKNAAGDWEGAEAAARQAIALDPDDPRGYKELAVALLHQGKDAQALEAAERAAELDPEDADARMLMAFAFEGLGRREDMLRAVERAAALDPGRFSSYLDLARKGKRLFDRRRSMKGWHGIPVPAPGSDPAMAAPAAAGGPALTPDSRKRVVFLGGALVLLAAVLLGGAAWQRRREAGAIKVRTG